MPDTKQNRGQNRTQKTAQNTIDPVLLEVLVCPDCHGPLTYDRKRNELVSKQARLAYPIRDGVPIMLPSEARRIDDDHGG